MDKTNKLWRQNTMFVNSIDGKLDENVRILAVCVIKLTIEKIVVLELSELYIIFCFIHCVSLFVIYGVE